MSLARKALQLLVNTVRISFRSPRRLSHVFGTALAASDQVISPQVDLLRAPGVAPEDLLPSAGQEFHAVLAMMPKSNASLSLLEYICLVLLVKRAGAKAVFEFGTYKGVSITQLALNLPPGSRIFTLDLPEGQTESRFAISDPEDAVIAFERGKGALVPPEVRHRIEFLKCDSAAFDETPFTEQMDFVFVDGAHNAAYVRNDSEKGWRMLRRGGVIVWHDFRPQDPAVVTYLLESPYAVTRVLGTTFAFATKL